MPKYRVIREGLIGPGGRAHPIGFEFETKDEIPLSLRDKVVDLSAGVAGGTLVVADKKTGDVETTSAKPVTEMTVDQLKAHAAANGIDLEGATRKDDIIGKIEAATAAADEADSENVPFDRSRYEESAKTLDIKFDENTSDEDLKKLVDDQLG